MKKILSLILVLSLVLAFAAVGITGASAEGEYSFTGGATASKLASKNAHTLSDSPISVTPGTTYKFDLKIPEATSASAIRVIFATGATLPSTSYSYASANEWKKDVSYANTTDWQTLEFTIPADDTSIDWTQVNYISLRTARNFVLKADNAYSALYISYNVSLPKGVGYKATSVSGSNTVDGGADYSFKVDLKSGYQKGPEFAVKANGTVLTPAEDGVTYTISNVTTNYTVTVEGVVDMEGNSAAGGNVAEIGSSEAYLFEPESGLARKSGFYIDGLDVNVDMYGNESNFVFDAWLYISNIDYGYDIILQFYTDGHFDNSQGSNYTEKWIYRKEFKKGVTELEAGWNHVQIGMDKFRKGSEENTYTIDAYNAYQGSKKIIAFSMHENVASNYGNYSFAVANLVLTEGSNVYEVISPAAPKDVADMKPTLGTKTEYFSIGDVASLGETKAPEKEIPTGYFISNTEAVTLSPAGGSWDNGYVADTNAYRFTTTSKKTTVLFQNFNPPAVSAAGKYARFYLYIEDPSQISNLQWEVSSSGTYKGACIRYNMNAAKISSTFTSGWNLVLFKLATKDEVGESTDFGDKFYAVTLDHDKTMTGDVDYGAINFFRMIFAAGEQSTTVMVNSLQFDVDPGKQDAVDNVSSSSQEKVQKFFVGSSESVRAGNATGTWDTANKIEGDASYSIVVNKTTCTIENSLKAQGTIGTKCRYYLYIQDVSKLKVLQWEVSSSGTCTGNCIRYQIGTAKIAQTLASGWNRIDFQLVDSSSLTSQQYPYGVFSDLYGVGLGGGMTGNVDYSAINYFRFVIQVTDDGIGTTLKVNGLQIGLTNGSEGDNTPVFVITLAMLASALIAAGVYFYNKKRVK